MRSFKTTSATCFLWLVAGCDPGAGALDHAHDHDNDQDHEHEHQHEAQETDAFFGEDAAAPRGAAQDAGDEVAHEHEHDHDDDEHDHAR